MEAVMRRVELLLDQRRFGEARQMLMQGLADDPEQPLLNAFLAYCLRMEDRDEEALAPAQRALSHAPEWPFVHYVLALVYERSRSLWPPIVIHTVQNSVSIVLMYLSVA